MKVQLTDEEKLLKARLQVLDSRVVAKLEKIKYSEGWVERKKIGNSIRMIILSAIGNIESGRKEDLKVDLEKLNDLGVKIEF